MADSCAHEEYATAAAGYNMYDFQVFIYESMIVDWKYNNWKGELYLLTLVMVWTTTILVS